MTATLPQKLSARYGRTPARLTLAELDAVLAVSRRGDHRDRDLAAAVRRLTDARERRRRAIARAGAL